MPNPSVTRWIALMKVGDAEAATRLWERYFDRLVHLARHKLLGMPRRAADEEDVALSAFNSFCRAAARGRFPDLQERDSLWRLLIAITSRKAHHLRRDESCGRRDFRRTVPEGAQTVTGSDEFPASVLEGVASEEPSPAFAAEVAEASARLLELLDDDQLRRIALWKMEGYTNDEVAAALDCAVSTVERRLRLIRDLWSRELPP